MARSLGSKIAGGEAQHHSGLAPVRDDGLERRDVGAAERTRSAAPAGGCQDGTSSHIIHNTRKSCTNVRYLLGSFSLLWNRRNSNPDHTRKRNADGVERVPAAEAAGDHDGQQGETDCHGARDLGHDADPRECRPRLPTGSRRRRPTARHRRAESSSDSRSREGSCRPRHPWCTAPARRRRRAPAGDPARRAWPGPAPRSSPTGTRAPSRPSCRISRGPLGQSVETTRAPAASASISTVGRPSQAEESTNSGRARHVGHRVVRKPGRATSSATPSSLISVSSSARSSPSPRMIRRAARRRRTQGKGPHERAEVFLPSQPADAQDDRWLPCGEPGIGRAC